MNSSGGTKTNSLSRASAGHPIRRMIGWLGVVLATPFFIWLPLGLVPGIPNMMDIFGISGLRTPAAITIAGLLLGAIGFFER